MVVGQGANTDQGKKQLNNVFMTWGLVMARKWSVTEKGLINYCRMGWIRVLTSYLSVYYGIHSILATTQDNSYGQFSHK